jgi:hypothetical protein
MHIHAEEEVARAEREAIAIAKTILQKEFGLTLENESGGVPVFAGRVSIGIAGGALGLCAGWLLAAASDESFEVWIRTVRMTRGRTRAEHLAEH